MSRAVDFFAGAGGWDLALAAAGVEADGVENMKEARMTRDAAGLSTVHDDVWTFDRDRLSEYEGQVDSPPCPPFSVAGKGDRAENLRIVRHAIATGLWRSRTALQELAGQVDDPRTALCLMPLHFWATGEPEWVAWEQVPGVLPVWEDCAAVMRAAGYHVVTANLQAETFGTPQTRKRAVLIGHRDQPVSLPVATHSRFYPRNKGQLDLGVMPWVSMAEALGWGLTDRPAPTVTGGGTETGGAEPIAHLDRYTSRPSWCWERPAPTMVGSFHPEVVAAPGYRTTVSRQNMPNSARVTYAESGILQSFPADHPWQGSLGKRYLQAGNAVPPTLAAAVLAAVGVSTQLVERTVA